MVYSAFADLVRFEQLPEKPGYFIDEAREAGFVAHTGAVCIICRVKVYKCEVVFVRVGFCGGTGVAGDGEVVKSIR